MRWMRNTKVACTGYTYAREGHPNAETLAQRIDALEGAEGGLVVGSGMAAVTAALLGLCSAGDHVLGGDQLYGRSLRLMRDDLPRMGIATSLADPTDADAFAAAIRPETRLILLEVVSNPTLRVADVIAAIAALARARGILLAIDNTFTTPRAVRAQDHGADIVIHSVTKMLAGHSDATLGYVTARAPAHRKAIYDFAVTVGFTPSPFDCWLAERGLLSFALRYDRAEQNAGVLADHLATLPGVSRVLYPTRRSPRPRPCRCPAWRGAAGTWSASRSWRACRSQPAGPRGRRYRLRADAGRHRHHAVASGELVAPRAGAQARAALGISEGFFRVSVGVEDSAALCDNLTAAVAAAAG